MLSPAARLTQLLTRRGGAVGRKYGAGLELVASVGPRELLRRSREQSAHDEQWPGRLVYRRIWEDAALACGVRFRELADGFFELGAASPPARVWMHMTPLDNEVALRFALDKMATHRTLEAEGLPMPEHLGFDFADPTPARQLVEAGGEWVVKPAGGTSSGQGTTAGVRTPAELLRASARVARSSGRQLLERRVAGDEYRLLLLDGEVLGALRRSPPMVTGDGVRTVAELVHVENRRRLELAGEAGISLITLDLDALLALEHAGSAPDEVPAPGAEVRVKNASSQAGRREVETVDPGSFCEELIEEGRRAARALDLHLAGIDLIATDLSRPMHASGGAIIEVNGTPGLHYHYLVKDEATRVAVPVLTRILEATA
jgi:cyanophycin synthetase